MAESHIAEDKWQVRVEMSVFSYSFDEQSIVKFTISAHCFSRIFAIIGMIDMKGM